MPSVDRIVVGSCHPGDNNKMNQPKKMSIISDIGYLVGEKNKIMKQKIFVSFFFPRRFVCNPLLYKTKRDKQSAGKFCAALR